MRKPSPLDSPLRSKTPVAPPQASFDVVHAGTRFKVAVKRVGTARRFTLRVRAASRDAVLTMPPRASMRIAKAFVESHAEWIGTRLSRLPDRRALAPGAVVPLRGVDHRVVHDPAHRSLRRVVAEPSHGDAAEGDAMPLLRVSGRVKDAGRHLFDFLRREAHRDLSAAVERHGATLGEPVRRIAIRDTTSRWGSCSSKGNLNFSWRLIMAPPHVLDYLAAHECAHLRHMNHSAAFWALTESLMPDMAEAEAWLRRHGATLHLYGV